MAPNTRILRAGLIAGALVAVAVALYAALFSATCLAKFANFRYLDFDLAAHAQSVWNIRHGSLDSSILGIPFLGNHMVPILFLLAPFCTVLDPARSLLLIQSVVLALGGWGVFLLARRALPLPWAVAWACLYLLYPPLWYMNLYEFHPIALATTFLIFAIHFYREQRFAPYAALLSLSLLCQENVALMVAGFGVLALLQRRKGRWVWAPLAVGAGWFILAAGIIMPRLNQDRIMFFAALYGHLGATPGGVLLHILLHPIHTASVALQPDKLRFLASLLTPGSFVALLNPVSFVPALPVLAQRLLSGRGTETSILFHYQAELIPFVFAASIEGTRRILAWKKPVSGWGLAAVLAAAAALCVARSSIADLWAINGAPANDVASTRQVRLRTLRNIPPDAGVIATFRCLPALSGRTGLYSLHLVYNGRYPLSRAAYPMPDVDYIVLDAFDPLVFLPHGSYGPGKYRNLQALMARASWDIVEQVDSFTVLRRSSRVASTNGPLVDIRGPDSDASSWRHANLEGGGDDVQLVGFRTGELDGDANLPLLLCWTKPEETATDYDMLLEFHDGPFTCWKRVAAGQRIWPTQSWPAGKWVIDRQRIHLDGHEGPLRRPGLTVHLRPIAP